MRDEDGMLLSLISLSIVPLLRFFRCCDVLRPADDAVHAGFICLNSLILIAVATQCVQCSAKIRKDVSSSDGLLEAVFPQKGCLIVFTGLNTCAAVCLCLLTREEGCTRTHRVHVGETGAARWQTRGLKWLVLFKTQVGVTVSPVERYFSRLTLGSRSCVTH